jgi:hypothetical protein
MLTSSVDSRDKGGKRASAANLQEPASKSSMVTLITTPVNNELDQKKKSIGLKTQYVLPVSNINNSATVGGTTNRVFSSNRMSTTHGGTTTTTSDRKFYNSHQGSHSKEPRKG